jgi:hypothetical protein
MLIYRTTFLIDCSEEDMHTGVVDDLRVKNGALACSWHDLRPGFLSNTLCMAYNDTIC